MVLKTWIADAKEVIYEVEDLLIETDSEAQQIVLVAGSQTSMLEDKSRSLHLMKQPPSHECVPLTSLLGHTRVYGRDQSKEAIKKLLLSDDAEGETFLARFVYDNDEVKKWFDLKAWVSVSQELNVHDFWNDDPEECNFLIAPLMAGVEGKYAFNEANHSAHSCIVFAPCSINEIGELKCLEGRLRTWMLQNVVDAQDALGDNLEGTRDLRKLDLRWSNDSYGSLDERVLHQLKPDMNVRCLVIVGYGGSRFPAWLIDPFLVDLEAYIAFKSLESLTFERMPQWCEWVPNVAESEEKAFPRLQVLCISEGPKLKKTLPSHLPSLKELTITKCSQFVLSLPRPTTINKMSLKDSLNDHPHMVKLETLTSGGHSLLVQSCYSLDSLLKEMEQLGYFLTIHEISIHGSSLKCYPVELFLSLKQLDC
ncbi:hypothetical protein POTOM_054331 [Populus tomentosa]|uniref:R13L1/DRL21-like LRR repeat region domain-containing protein n=1 Tax=Populus tomentosa TaxID=118781 RepID=A0A8X8C6X1_POPTO|nr:hypothetical protein POTOM_054331 [Populus tomentosa]